MRGRVLYPAISLVILLLVAVAQAADGDLDPHFGVNGIVSTDFAGAVDSLLAVAMQGDGKLVAVGVSGTDFALARYNVDGTLDSTFGTQGKVLTKFRGQKDEDVARGVAVQTDGKIVVAGDSAGDVVVARYNADGSLDRLFGTGGGVSTDLGGDADSGEGIALQPDGKIVVCGNTTGGIALVRYTERGRLDRSFGDGGVVVVTALRYFRVDLIHALAIQPDGKIVVAGAGRGPTTGIRDDFLLARFNSDGTLDAGFGSNRGPFGELIDRQGIVTTDFGGRIDHARDLIIQPDGKIIVAGDIGTSRDDTQPPDFGMARYDAIGTLDPTFGTGGRVRTALVTSYRSGSGILGVALQNDSKIVAAGYIYKDSLTERGVNIAAVRYESNGTPDAAFGAAGTVVTDLGQGTAAIANDVLVQPDGKIVIAATGGVAFVRSGSTAKIEITDGADFVLARYLNE